ncbi:MAG: flagellar protein FliT [Lachnospiraceae bacterium]|nr:flagellar protein FliT [Lachnospiraceae bacterium]
MNNNYILILIESLQKKIKVLDEIIVKNTEQTSLVSKKDLDLEKFDKNVDEKEKLIEELNLLDQGFEAVYDRIKEEFISNKNLYKKEISTLQDLISQITEKSMKIQAEEERNRKMIVSHMALEKNKIRQAKTNSKVATNYYTSMKNINTVDPQFMDKKK